MVNAAIRIVRVAVPSAGAVKYGARVTTTIMPGGIDQEHLGIVIKEEKRTETAAKK